METFCWGVIRQSAVKFCPPPLPHPSSQWMTTSPTNVGSPHPLPFLPGAARHGQQTTWPCWVETQTHSARLSRTITTFALLSVLQVGDNHVFFFYLFIPRFLSFFRSAQFFLTCDRNVPPLISGRLAQHHITWTENQCNHPGLSFVKR